MADSQSPTEKPPASENEMAAKIPDSQNAKTAPSSCKNEKSEAEFEPHNFGDEDGIGLFGVAVHIMRSTIGCGILMMPFAMKHLGIINGTIVIIFVGILYYHNVHILVSTEYHLCKDLKLKSLPFVGVTRKCIQRAPFPWNKLKSVIPRFAHLYLSLPTSPSTYLIIMATNIRLMADYFDVKLNETLIITALIIPFILFTQSRRILKILVPFSSATNCFTVVMISIIITYSFIYREVNFSVKMFGDLNFIPKGFAMFILTVRSTGIMLPLKNAMKKPKLFSVTCGSLNIAGLNIVLIYYCFALICYVNYGDAVQENILSNLPSKSWVSFTVYLLYTFAMSINYILTYFSCFDNLWSGELESLMKPGLLRNIWECGVKAALNLLAYFLAVAVPQLSLIAAITGTLGILVEIALPPFLELILQMTQKNIKCTTVLKDLFIIVISCVLFCMSATRCVYDLVQLYSQSVFMK